MDYFSFYELPLRFNTDDSLIKKKFYELSKKYHPDFYINESEDKQQEVLELSTLNNKAYQILSDPEKRLQYILELKELIHEGESYKLPQDFLMDMMEVNEELMELQFDPDPSSLRSLTEKVGHVKADLRSNLQQLMNKFDENLSNENAAILNDIKDLYYRNKYLIRIEEGIKKMEV